MSSSPDIRLVNGYRNSSGVLEVLVGGSWGMVCDTSYIALNFHATAARVACQQLGYAAPVRWGSSLHSNLTNNQVSMVNVNCSSSASRLQDCSFSLDSSSGCGKENIVSLECTDCSKYLCTDGQCVDAVSCNGAEECYDGSDENLVECGESIS